MLKVMVCDDAVAFSALLRHWIGEVDDLEVVAATSAPDEAVRLCARLQPDVVLLDHILGRSTSESLVPRLRQAAPGARILLMSGMPEDMLGASAERSGADGHLSKASDATMFRAAVRRVAGTPRALLANVCEEYAAKPAEA